VVSDGVYGTSAGPHAPVPADARPGDPRPAGPWQAARPAVSDVAYGTSAGPQAAGDPPPTWPEPAAEQPEAPREGAAGPVATGSAGTRPDPGPAGAEPRPGPVGGPAGAGPAAGEAERRPEPLGVVLRETGNAEVDAAVARLADADELPTAGHVEVYEDVHRGLRDALTALDENRS
jgi:hypothetical protein